MFTKVSRKVALLSEYLGPVVLCVITVFKPLARIIIIVITVITITILLLDVVVTRQAIIIIITTKIFWLYMLSSQCKNHCNHCNHHHQDLLVICYHHQ